MSATGDPRYEIVPDDSPDRCVEMTQRGQCRMKRREDNPKFCHAHARAQGQQRDINLLRLAVYSERVKEGAEHPRIKTLNNEVAVLRMLLEEKLNTCKTLPDLMLKSQGIANLVMQVGQIVLLSQKLEAQAGNHLTKTQVEAFANSVVSILATEIDPEVLERVANKLEEAMTNAFK